MALFGPPAASRNIGGFVVAGNTSVTRDFGFHDLDLGLSGVLSHNSRGWVLSDVGSGELTYQGSRPFSGTLVNSMTVKSAASLIVTFRMVRNGLVLPDGVLMDVRTNASTRGATLTTPLTMVAGDTLKTQLLTSIDNRDVTVEDLSLQCH